jgi:hypothetical protein
MRITRYGQGARDSLGKLCGEPAALAQGESSLKGNAPQVNQQPEFGANRTF